MTITVLSLKKTKSIHKFFIFAVILSVKVQYLKRKCLRKTIEKWQKTMKQMQHLLI